MDDRFGLETAEELAGVHVPDVARRQLVRYVELLRNWQNAKNLVSKDTLNDVWTRHVADGLQLLPLIGALSSERDRQDLRGVDLGSGAGLPGMILALGQGATKVGEEGPYRKHQPSGPLHMTLVEANGRKASFLRTVSRETDVPATVLNHRIEALHRDALIPADFVTARALAPLSKLIELAKPWLDANATAFFHKGGEYARELEEWTDVDAFDVVEHVSVVDPNSRILQITKRMRRDQG